MIWSGMTGDVYQIYIGERWVKKQRYKSVLKINLYPLKKFDDTNLNPNEYLWCHLRRKMIGPPNIHKKQLVCF